MQREDFFSEGFTTAEVARLLAVYGAIVGEKRNSVSVLFNSNNCARSNVISGKSNLYHEVNSSYLEAFHSFSLENSVRKVSPSHTLRIIYWR